MREVDVQVTLKVTVPVEIPDDVARDPKQLLGEVAWELFQRMREVYSVVDVGGMITRIDMSGEPDLGVEDLGVEDLGVEDLTQD